MIGYIGMKKMSKIFFTARAKELKVILERIHHRQLNELDHEKCFHDKRLFEITKITFDLNVELAKSAKHIETEKKAENE